MTFEVTAVRQDGIETKIGKKIQLYVAAEQAAQLQEGDGLRCTVKLRRPETAAYSGAFDSRTIICKRNVILLPMPMRSLQKRCHSAGLT